MELASLYLQASNSIQPPDNTLMEECQKMLAMAMWSSEPEPFDPMEIALHEAYRKHETADKRPEFKLVQY